MSWFESKETGKKEYLFGQGGGPKLAEELQAPLLGQIPLGQPDWNEADFAPSVYLENHPTGKIYEDIANQILKQFANK
jgi:ATP-binding protein involved in chromosome partitioning